MFTDLLQHWILSLIYYELLIMRSLQAAQVTSASLMWIEDQIEALNHVLAFNS